MSKSGMRTTRAPSPKSQPSRPIKHFDRPSPGPHHRPPAATPPTPSNDVAAHAVRVASNPGSINIKKQVY